MRPREKKMKYISGALMKERESDEKESVYMEEEK